MRNLYGQIPRVHIARFYVNVALTLQYMGAFSIQIRFLQFSFSFFGHAMRLVESQFPDQGLNASDSSENPNQ